MAFISGKAGRFRLGASTNIPVTKWSAVINGTDLDTSNSEGGGYEECVDGLARADVTISLNYDTVLAFANMVKPNAIYAVNLFPTLTDLTRSFAGNVFVRSVNVTSDVHGLVSLEVTGRTTGGFTMVGL